MTHDEALYGPLGRATPVGAARPDPDDAIYRPPGPRRHFLHEFLGLDDQEGAYAAFEEYGVRTARRRHISESVLQVLRTMEGALDRPRPTMTAYPRTSVGCCQDACLAPPTPERLVEEHLELDLELCCLRREEAALNHRIREIDARRGRIYQRQGEVAHLVGDLALKKFRPVSEILFRVG